MRVMGLGLVGGVDLFAHRLLSSVAVNVKKVLTMPRGVYPRMTPEQQFWRRVVIVDGCCWGWTGSKSTFGYGTFPVKRKRALAHRFSYMLHKGVIPAGMVVRHTCHNASCTNPDHLLLGTQADNIQDSVSDNRHVHGESHGCSKLTEEQVLSIRSQRASGESYPSLAAKFGVSSYTIGEICRRETWGHL